MISRKIVKKVIYYSLFEYYLLGVLEKNVFFFPLQPFPCLHIVQEIFKALNAMRVYTDTPIGWPFSE